MPKTINYDALTACFNVIAGAGHMVACPTQPVDSNGAQTIKLCDVTMAAGDYVQSAGLVSGGRRVTVGAKSGVAVTVAGTANFVCLLDTATNRVLYTTVCPAQALAVGGTVSFAAWDIEISDPV